MQQRRMDRNLRLRASDRRASGPPDPSRQHPRDERRQLSSGPKPGPQRHRHQLGSGQIGPRGPKRPGTRQLYRERRHLGALRIPGARFRHPQVANICSATWPVVAPPLTIPPRCHRPEPPQTGKDLSCAAETTNSLTRMTCPQFEGHF